jgi:hypothetical protein
VNRGLAGGRAMTRCGKKFDSLFLRICLLALAGMATLVIGCSDLAFFTRTGIAGVLGTGSLVALVFGDRRTLLGFLAISALVLGWWLLMPPSNDRNWQPDVALLPWGEIQGSQVTLHNIRNCDYRSETDYTVRHYDKTYDLAKLKSVDLFLVHWGSPYIAHSMLSFDFEGEGNVCISIETRRRVGQDYSTLMGLFRQFELTYVVADERDLIGLRTNYRHEQVYLYPLKTSEDFARKVFLNYLGKINGLRQRPEWYNALTGNCTTGMRGRTAPYNPDGSFDWRIIVNGYLDEMLYERGRIDTSLPFPELKKRSLINQKAQGLDKSPDFSRLIRAGLPGQRPLHETGAQPAPTLFAGAVSLP